MTVNSIQNHSMNVIIIFEFNRFTVLLSSSVVERVTDS